MKRRIWPSTRQRNRKWSLILQHSPLKNRVNETQKFPAKRHGKHRVRLYPEHVAERARPAPMPPKGGVISRFGKNTPLKKLIISERDKGNINLRVDFPFTAAGNAHRKGVSGHLDTLKSDIKKFGRLLNSVYGIPEKPVFL